MKIGPIQKAVVAALFGLLQVTWHIVSDNVLDLQEAARLASELVLAIGAVWGVYATPNKPLEPTPVPAPEPQDQASE